VRQTRRAKLILSRSALHKALRLPDDIVVTGFDHTNDPCSVTIHLEGHAFEPVDDDDESPLTSWFWLDLST